MRLAGFFCKILLSAGQPTDQGEESLVVVVVVLNLDTSVLHPSRFSPIFGTILLIPGSLLTAFFGPALIITILQKKCQTQMMGRLLFDEFFLTNFHLTPGNLTKNISRDKKNFLSQPNAENDFLQFSYYRLGGVSAF